MSFFFDVLTNDGFVLVADVRLTEEVSGVRQQRYVHKILSPSFSNQKVDCAIAICGDDLDVCKGYFKHACAVKDTLRDVAECFATEWTEHFAGENKDSAIHVVGYETIPGSNELVPQLWYWHTWESSTRQYLTKQSLQNDLSSFANPIPANNHLPWLIRDKTGKFPGPTLQAERSLVVDYLQQATIFTWNGDISFWASASTTVSTAIDFVGGKKPVWNIADTVKLTGTCLEFLAKLGDVMPDSTVGLSPEGKYDVVILTPTEAKRMWAPLPAS
ncbi:MAG: hypothetical protein MN733_07605 [Nitrososphaera sp.]|nr:hypothetical protein [Nitrososphaera sp.]